MSTSGHDAALAQALQRGETLLGLGRLAEAGAAFADAAALAPHDVLIALAQANAHRLRGALDAELVVLREAFANGDRRDARVAHALGAALLTAGEANSAVICFEVCAAERPHDVGALGSLASALRAAGEPERAWTTVLRALRIAPAMSTLLRTAAQIRHDLGDLDGSLRWLDRDARANSESLATQRQRAWTTLMRGVTSEGWALFESRARPVPETTARPWRGEPLAGGSVLVAAEQGVGDQLQFLRFVPRLLAHGAGPIIVECHADLVSFVADQGMTVVARGEAPATAWHVPIGSLPHWLQTGADVLGASVPYLRVPETMQDRAVSDRLPPARVGVRRLGLVWAGNPVFPGRATRDLDPSCLPRLMTLPGIEWIILQQGAAAAEAPPGAHRIPPLQDWRETAHVLAQLDGLVTTDTGIAHLAGAMGIPLWVLLQRVPDWRWGLSDDRTPWYPSARLLRRGRTGGWPTVINALAAALSVP